MVGKKSKKWRLLLSAGLFLIAAQMVLGHFFVSRPWIDEVRGFCMGVGITLELAALILSKRESKAL